MMRGCCVGVVVRRCGTFGCVVRSVRARLFTTGMRSRGGFCFIALLLSFVNSLFYARLALARLFVCLFEGILTRTITFNRLLKMILQLLGDADKLEDASSN